MTHTGYPHTTPHRRGGVSRFVACSVRCLALGISIAGAALGQAPKHVAIVGTISPPNGTRGTTGVFYVDLPRPTSGDPGGRITPLAPLPPRLTMKPYSGMGGAASVLYRPSDGTLFVGDGAGPGQWAHVHILKLAGQVVVGSKSVRVGKLPNIPGLGIGVNGLALLPDGRVAVASVVGFVQGPLSASPIGILDDRPATPTVTPVMLTGNPPLPALHVSGLVVSADGRTAYLINTGSLPNPAPSRLYAIDLTKTSAVAPVLLHTWKDCWVTKLTAGPGGVMFAGCGQPSLANPKSWIEEIRVVNNTATVKSTQIPSPALIIGVALDPATRPLLLATADLGNSTFKNSVLMYDRATNKLSPLTGPPPGEWGLPAGIDVNSTFQTYGTGTNGANDYAFAEFPNPGGLPEVGNTAFSLTVRSTPGTPTASFMVLATARADRPFLGIRLLVDLGQPHVLVPMSTGRSAGLPLPLPNDPALRGIRFYAQSAHTDAGSALATSNGISIVIR